MRKPETIEYLYLDFDGFFASVEQQIQPSLRGRPVGVIPFKTETDFTCVIACSKEAKAQGFKNVMGVREAKKACPDLVLVPQKPDMYRRAHDALCSSIDSIIPIDVRKSIDELACRLDARDIADPHSLSRRIKSAISEDVGQCITCSIGFAANRHLAKIACKIDKPDGTTVWTPEMVPHVMDDLPFDDLPGVGARMQIRLWQNGIQTPKQLLSIEPKHMRKLWGNVSGERLWYALHGYAIKALPPKRGMYGHGRVLPPAMRKRDDAIACSKILAVKAARRMRRDGFFASKMHIWMQYRTPEREDKGWGTWISMYFANDDHACLSALTILWKAANQALRPDDKIIKIGLYYGSLVTRNGRQLDLLHGNDNDRQKWERITGAMDRLNSRYCRSVVTIGTWNKQYGEHLGTKIAFTRIPSIEDAI